MRLTTTLLDQRKSQEEKARDKRIGRALNQLSKRRRDEGGKQ